MHQTCKLLCCLSGKPTPTVKWFKGSTELNKNQYTITYADGVVTAEIVNCRPEDSGKYKCVATNPLGSDETYCVVIVEGGTPEQEKAMFDRFSKEERRFAPAVPHQTSTDSSTASGGRSAVQTTPTVSLTPAKTNGRATQSPVKQTSGGSDKRQLKPYGKTSTSGNRSRSATKELEVPPDDSLMHAPVFEDKMAEAMTVQDGSQLALRCQVNGDPSPQISWTKNDQAISSSDVVDLKYRNGVASLVINEVFPEDEGVYVFRAHNSLGEISADCRVTVVPMDKSSQQTKRNIQPPRVVKHLTSRVVKDGEAVVLSCRLSGQSKFDVVWLHNNKEIKSSSDFKYDSEGDSYYLRIAEIFPEDTGAYTCEAFNDAGESFSSCTVVVRAGNDDVVHPVFETFPASASVNEGDPFSTSFTLSKAASKVVWYKDGKAMREHSGRVVIASNKNKHTLTINCCQTSDIGQYSVKAIGKKTEPSANFSLNVNTKNN